MTNAYWRAFVSLLLILLFAGAAVLAYRYNYPYGARPACLPNVLEALRAYSADNGGAFPNSATDPLEALRKLFPKYLAAPEPLAGLSGDRQLLRKQMAEGSGITEKASSWVYWPDLRSDDNPDIALVWERQPGLRFNGSRAGGHEVGFIGGYMKQVPDLGWEAFLREQEELRHKAIASRRGKTD
jgi:hypothetical protein